MKTIRETHSDRKTLLRLVDTGNMFVGLATANCAATLKVEGDAAESVWQRLHDEVGNADPK